MYTLLRGRLLEFPRCLVIHFYKDIKISFIQLGDPRIHSETTPIPYKNTCFHEAIKCCYNVVVIYMRVYECIYFDTRCANSSWCFESRDTTCVRARRWCWVNNHLRSEDVIELSLVIKSTWVCRLLLKVWLCLQGSIFMLEHNTALIQFKI